MVFIEFKIFFSLLKNKLLTVKNGDMCIKAVRKNNEKNWCRRYRDKGIEVGFRSGTVPACTMVLYTQILWFVYLIR